MTNWTPFIYGLGAVYLLYYLANLAFDFLKPRTPDTGESSLMISLADLEELIDASEYSPALNVKLNHPQELLSSGEISSSGGVLFGGIMELAANDAIFFTKQIPG